MDMKNTTILLMLLLCVLGLIVGVYYTDAGEPALNLDDFDEVIHEDANGTITIELEKKDGTPGLDEKFQNIFSVFSK